MQAQILAILRISETWTGTRAVAFRLVLQAKLRKGGEIPSDQWAAICGIFQGLQTIYR